MTINVNAAGGKLALDSANPQQIADLLRAIAVGHVVRALPTWRRGLAPAAAASNPYVNASALSVTLADDAKAAFIFRAYARSGTGTVGPLTIDTPDPSGAAAQPAAGHVAFSPSGDLVFNGADAWTSVDVLYMPEKYDIYEGIFSVATNVVTLPTATQGLPVFILEAEGLAPSDVKCIVDAPGTAVATGHAALASNKLTVNFAAGNAFTSARVKWAAVAAVDVDAFLTQAQVYV